MGTRKWMRRRRGDGHPHGVRLTAASLRESCHTGADADGVLAPVIDVVAVSKRFGDVLAVDQVSVRVDHGEIYGFSDSTGPASRR